MSQKKKKTSDISLMELYNQFVSGSPTTKNGVITLLMNIFYHILKSTKYGNVSKENCVIHKQTF